MTQPLRWGILGTGNIARQFAAGLATSARTAPAAVASRKMATADEFAKAHRIPRAYGSYADLLRDADVDAVYVSLPNSMHHEWTLAALRAGKHVLCEKPIASNAAQAEEMFDAAQSAGRVLVEAFMYRSHPLTHAALAAVRAGEIGQVKLIRTSFCFRTTRQSGNIRFDAALAGGSLMDVGCYCLNFSRLFAGAEPTSAHAVGTLHPAGVDESAAAVLTFPAGVTATFACGMIVQADNTAHVCGTDGYLAIPIPWKPPRQDAELHIIRGTPPKMDGPVQPPPPKQTRRASVEKDLYALEADDFATAALDGAPPRLDRQDSIGNMRVLDDLRRQVGVVQ